MSAPNENEQAVLDRYQDLSHSLRIFMRTVADTIGTHPALTSGPSPVVHSYKYRLKDPLHLLDKLRRKAANGVVVTAEELHMQITDLAGVRVLHLFQEDFRHIHNVILSTAASGDWCLAEEPQAYTWDPEALRFFEDLGLRARQKSTSYTSVHYLVKPRVDSPQCCEIQVRTLFEEIWGEVDHQINYPHSTESLACREQIMVLSKIVGAGSRLLDSLKRVHSSENGLEGGST